MKHLLLPILFFMALDGHSTAAQSTWQTYSLPDATFSIELPAKLQKVMSFEGEHGASLERDQEINFADCYAAIETIPSKSRFGIIVIKAEHVDKSKMSRAEFVTALSFTFLADDDETQYLTKPLRVHTNGLFGQEYFYVNDRRGDFSVFIRGRILDTGSRIYVLVFVGRDEKDLTSTDAGRFFNSFRVTGPRKNW